jgi:hypothetical protein
LSNIISSNEFISDRRKEKKGGNIHLLSNIISSNEFISDRRKEKRMDIAITSDELLHCSPILFTVHASVDGKVLVQGNHNIFSCLDRIVGRRDGVARVLFGPFVPSFISFWNIGVISYKKTT